MKYQKRSLFDLANEPDFYGEYVAGKELEFELAHDIFVARLLKGLSQEDLALLVETSQAVISRLESGRHTPSLSLVKRVAKALGLAAKVYFY